MLASNKFILIDLTLRSKFLGLSSPIQYYQPPMPPPPPPRPAPPLLPNPEFFPGIDIDDEMEDDILWDNEELNDDDANPVIEC